MNNISPFSEMQLMHLTGCVIEEKHLPKAKLTLFVRCQMPEGMDHPELSPEPDFRKLEFISFESMQLYQNWAERLAGCGCMFYTYSFPTHIWLVQDQFLAWLQLMVYELLIKMGFNNPLCFENITVIVTFPKSEV